MNKQMTLPIRVGQSAGTQIKIAEVHNDALREHITLVNRGALAQPLGGWALATLRGEKIFFLPDDVILQPGIRLVVFSGQDAPDHPAHDLRLAWTHEQVWNNRSDVAVLFDFNGAEVDRYVYPPERPLRRLSQRRKRLARDGEAWRIVDEPKPNKQADPHKDKRAPRR